MICAKARHRCADTNSSRVAKREGSAGGGAWCDGRKGEGNWERRRQRSNAPEKKKSLKRGDKVGDEAAAVGN